MITHHPLNIKLSEEIYNKYKHEIEKGACYNNIFSVIMACKTKLKSKEWKIAYGYYAAMGDIMARHCFIVNENGEAIDPTLMTHYKQGSNEDEEYQSFHLIDNMHDYIELIIQNNDNPNLLFSLYKQEQEIFEWARTHDRILIGQ